jgi:hypothetical protein
MEVDIGWYDQEAFGGQLVPPSLVQDVVPFMTGVINAAERAEDMLKVPWALLVMVTGAQDLEIGNAGGVQQGAIVITESGEGLAMLLLVIHILETDTNKFIPGKYKSRKC